MTALRPYQIEAIDGCLESLREHQRVLVCMPTGCFSPDQIVLRADGRPVPIDTIKVGDQLMGPGGEPRAVAEVHAGQAPFVRVTPVKGDPWACTTDHVLTLINTTTGEIADVPVAEWMIWPKSRKHLWKLVRSGLVEFGSDRALPLDPYFLGLLLGDGSLSKTGCAITTMEPEVLDVMHGQAETFGLNVVCAGVSGKARTWRLSLPRHCRGRGCRNPIVESLRSLGLMPIASADRFVPDLYKFGPAQVRREVLAGLVDTDGYATSGGYDIVFKSRQLMDDVAYLARSLGLACYIRPKTYKGTVYYRGSISGDCATAIPCRVARRKLAPRRQIKSVTRTGFSIEIIDGLRPYVGVTLEDDPHFLLGDFTIAHNCGKTVTFADIAARYVAAGHRVGVLAHRKELLDQAARKLFDASGIVPAIEQAERAEATDDSPIVVASVQSMITRLDRFPADAFRLLIIDEAHRSLAPTYVRLLEHFACKVLGFTATPNRGDERALAQVYGAVGYDLTLADAIAGGWLVPPRVITIDAPSLDLGKVRSRSGELVAGELGPAMSEISVLREAIGPALRYAWSKKTLVFCATRAHMACVKACVEEMAADAGLELQVDMVDGTTAAGERDDIFARFRSSTARHWLLNIDVATEGFDDPGVEALLVLRPTLARPRYMQMIGRGLRPLAGLIDGVSVEEALVRLDMAEARGDDLTHLIRHRAALMAGSSDAFARRVLIASSSKPSCLILDVAGNSTRHELVNPLDLLGGDFEAVEVRQAQRIVADGLAPNLWAALEQARIKRERQREERLARQGDPFALFGLPVPARDRWGRKPHPKQRAVIASLQQPRNIDDARSADAIVREVARRDAAGLASYSQLRLLAKLGGPLVDLRAMSRRKAAEVIRRIAATGWRRPT